MNLSGVAIGTAPENLSALRETLAGFPWAEVHHTDAQGRIVITVEAADTGQQIERLRTVKRLPGVLFAEMVIHYSEDGLLEGDAASRDDAPILDYLNDDTETVARPGFLQRLKALGNY